MNVHEIMTQIVAEAAKNPGDNVMGSLLSPDHRPSRRHLPARQDQVVVRMVELAGAGFETTAKQIANAVVALAWYPDQRAELAADSSLMKNAVEEIVRWDPASHYVVRFIEEEVRLHGRRSRPTAGSCSSPHRRTTTSGCSTTPSCSTSIARSSVTLGLPSELTCASAPRWLAWRQRSRLRSCFARYPNYELSGPIERGYAGNVRGLDHLPIILEPAA